MNSGNTPDTADNRALAPSDDDATARPQALVTSRTANYMLDAAAYLAFVGVLASSTTPMVAACGAIAAPVLVTVMRRLL